MHLSSNGRWATAGPSCCRRDSLQFNCTQKFTQCFTFSRLKHPAFACQYVLHPAAVPTVAATALCSAAPLSGQLCMHAVLTHLLLLVVLHLSTRLCVDPQQQTPAMVQAALCNHEFMQDLTLSKAVQLWRSGSRASTEKMLLQLAPEPTVAFRSKVVVPPGGGASDSEEALLGAAAQPQHCLSPAILQLL